MHSDLTIDTRKLRLDFKHNNFWTIIHSFLLEGGNDSCYSCSSFSTRVRRRTTRARFVKFVRANWRFVTSDRWTRHYIWQTFDQLCCEPWRRIPPPSLTHRHRPAWKRLAPPSHRPAGQQSASANRCQQRNSLPVPTAQQSAIDCIVHFSRLSYELANALTAAARAAATRDYVESIVSEVLEIVTSTVQPSTSKGKGKGKCKGKGKSE